VTLGEVLMGDYSVACFDEISNGLDSSSALDIIRTIRAWATNFSYTCAISLLQPAPEVFALFDEVRASLAAIVWHLFGGERERLMIE
jgi:ABC-type multidrug transport system ATPase subunit